MSHPEQVSLARIAFMIIGAYLVGDHFDSVAVGAGLFFLALAVGNP